MRLFIVLMCALAPATGFADWIGYEASTCTSKSYHTELRGDYSVASDDMETLSAIRYSVELDSNIELEFALRKTCDFNWSAKLPGHNTASGDFQTKMVEVGIRAGLEHIHFRGGFAYYKMHGEIANANQYNLINGKYKHDDTIFYYGTGVHKDFDHLRLTLDLTRYEGVGAASLGVKGDFNLISLGVMVR